MTLQEAMDQRIPRVRQPIWANPNCYLRLPLLKDGHRGGWAELYDELGQKEALGIRPGSQKICVALPDVASQDGYEVYSGPVSEYEADKENFAGAYEEN
jgi:hypothetical protein